MTVNEGLRLLAGVIILLSVALGYYISPLWHLLTVFVGLNLLQSAFTRWCPAMTLLKRLGFKAD